MFQNSVLAYEEEGKSSPDSLCDWQTGSVGGPQQALLPVSCDPGGGGQVRLSTAPVVPHS